ncbi:MAG: hypothetical protein ABSE85_09885 [Candidatus Korobacteraceae bacterium]
MGKAEGISRSKEGCAGSEESLYSQADEPCYEEETISDDEGKVGSEKESCEVKPLPRRNSTVECKHRADSKGDSRPAD